MDAEFDSEYPTCRNGPISHLKIRNPDTFSILYSLDAPKGAEGATRAIESAEVGLQVVAHLTMRVIAGKYRSRQLRSLPGLDIRPTADRLRETLFNVFTAGNPDALKGTVWLDLYAGTGAVGIEALSRGASMVHFVESSAPAAELIKKNLASLEVGTGFQVLRQDSIRALRALESGGTVADFVFLDPPYDMQEAYRQALETLSKSKLLKQHSVVIAEHQKKFDPGEASGLLRRYRMLGQGDAALSLYRLAPAE
jgi:16S rRNA (guanine966-N2)-methyltransferase